MKIWMTSYADAAYRLSGERLVASAARYGIEEHRHWGREALERTSFYRMHRAVLDQRRGGGYWLWKPFIIHEALKDMAPGDLLVYADSGIEIIAPLHPLFEICQQRAPLMTFAGHYEDVKAPGPNLCGKWTKRDCFVGMDCDGPRYYDAQMVDASFLVLCNSDRTRAFIREWMLYCGHLPLLTDAANVCGLPNLPEFITHRWDQSVLALLARREDLELFRHPSQHGNHVKPEALREAGEWTRHPYGSKGLFHNSPYGTLLNHHRGNFRTLPLTTDVRRTLPAPRAQVYEAWNAPDVLAQWGALGHGIASVEMDVRTGGSYRLTLSADDGRCSELRGTYLDVQPLSRLVYSWPGLTPTQVTVSFDDDAEGTAIAIAHGPFATERACANHALMWSRLLDAFEVVLGARPAA
jgi:uncharacterized protein YndB with AHSA1/START domain